MENPKLWKTEYSVFSQKPTETEPEIEITEW